MHAGSQILNGVRVDVRRRPNEGFANPISLDPLAQYFDGSLYRIYPSQKYFAKGGSFLHRDVWAAAFGAIPKDHHIHHRDADKCNNQLSNLECLPASVHLSESRAKRVPGKDGWFNSEAKEAAKAWHRSDVGRLWHSRHAKRSQGWKKWKRVEKPCEECGETMLALERKSGYSQKYCTTACKAKAYKKRKEFERV
jgi:hypothetical protein